MFEKNNDNKRNNYYSDNITKRKNFLAVLKKASPVVTAVGLATTLAISGISVADAANTLNANRDRNAIIDMINAGEMEQSEQALNGMAKYIKSDANKNAFFDMTREEKLAYIESMLNKMFMNSNMVAGSGIVAMMALAILVKISREAEKMVSLDVDKLIYEMYLDEQCNPYMKKKLSKKELKQVEQHIQEDPEYSKEQAEKNIQSRMFNDDKQVYYNDYELGFKKGQSDFYSRCNYGSGNIYNKAMFYFQKGVSADKIDKKLVEVSYKKGFYRSAGLYMAEKLAFNQDLTDGEQAILDNMDNLSLDNVKHINKYSASEVMSRQDYWYGYIEGFKNEVTSNYSSIDFDLSGLSEDVKKTIDEALDTNSYKAAFYQGIEDGKADIKRRARQKDIAMANEILK